MLHAEKLLNEQLRAAVAGTFGDDFADWDPELRAATKRQFGHFQSNIALRLAKPLGLAPRAVADRLVAALDVADVCEPVTVAGAGFVNLTLTTAALAAAVEQLAADARLGAEVPAAKRIVVDYSSPNIAKQMQVWHLRSTVIGDAIGRVLAFVGHDVVRRNHVGDWGTQFGMLIEAQSEESATADTLDELVALYRRARGRFDSDEGFADRARSRVVALQQGDPDTLAVWQHLVDVSLTSFTATYGRLGVLLAIDDVAGESSYNDMLADVVADLGDAGLITIDDGADCVFLPAFAGKDGNPLPLIVRKRDGGFGYAATDLAAIRTRVADGADEILYVVDARQALHFAQVFATATAAGWLPEGAAKHIPFGTVLDEAGKPFKTRDGQAVTLNELLDIATDAAADLIVGRSNLDGDVTALAASIGIGAVKYADLMNDRRGDYTFTAKRLVSMDGNTGPYLQYAHARLCSLLDKAGGGDRTVTQLELPQEQELAFAVTRFPEAIERVLADLEPHHLCGYLYELASTLSSFYEACNVLAAEGAQRSTRLGLCATAKTVLATGLDLLGIDAPTRM